MGSGWERRHDEEIDVKGRMLTVCVVLAMAVAACTNPGVVGGDDMNQESESVTNDATTADEEDRRPIQVPVQQRSPVKEASAEEPAPDPEEKQPLGPGIHRRWRPILPKRPQQPPPSPAATGSRTVDPRCCLSPIRPRRIWPDGSGSIPRDCAHQHQFRHLARRKPRCPQPGIAYTQVLVSGSLVVLQVNGVIYESTPAAATICSLRDPHAASSPGPATREGSDSAFDTVEGARGALLHVPDVSPVSRLRLR